MAHKVKKVFGVMPEKVTVLNEHIHFDEHGIAEIEDHIADILKRVPGYEFIVEEQKDDLGITEDQEDKENTEDTSTEGEEDNKEEPSTEEPSEGSEDGEESSEEDQAEEGSETGLANPRKRRLRR